MWKWFWEEEFPHNRGSVLLMVAAVLLLLWLLLGERCWPPIKKYLQATRDKRRRRESQQSQEALKGFMAAMLHNVPTDRDLPTRKSDAPDVPGAGGDGDQNVQ
jgi:hypothetical protein